MTIGGGVVLLQDVAVNDVRGLLQTELADLRRARLHQIVIEFDSGGIGMIFLRRHDHDAAIAAAEIEHLFAGFELDQIQHPLDDAFGSRIVRGEFFACGLLTPAAGRTAHRRVPRSRKFVNAFSLLHYRRPAARD